MKVSSQWLTEVGLQDANVRKLVWRSIAFILRTGVYAQVLLKQMFLAAFCRQPFCRKFSLTRSAYLTRPLGAECPSYQPD